MTHYGKKIFEIFFFSFFESTYFNSCKSAKRNFSKNFCPENLPGRARKTRFGPYLENQVIFWHAVFASCSAMMSTAFWRIFRKIVRAIFEKSWKNLISGHFLPSGGRAKFFWDMRSSPSSSPYWGLTSCKNSEKSYDSIFRKVRKSVILGQILPFLPSGGRAKFFFENRALSVFIIYHEITPCQKLEKSYDGKYQNSDIT